MEAYGYSLVLMGVGIVIGLAVILLVRPDEMALAGAVVAGLVTALADFVCAALGHRYDLWHLNGAFEVLSVPLSLSLAWVFLTAGLIALFDRLQRFMGRLALIAVAAVAGALVDHYVFRPFGIVTWGRLHPAAITPYWLAMVGLSVGTYGLVLRLAAPPAHRP